MLITLHVYNVPRRTVHRCHVPPAAWRRYGTRVRVSGLSQVSEIEAAEKERMKAKARTRTRRTHAPRRTHARTRLAARSHARRPRKCVCACMHHERV